MCPKPLMSCLRVKLSNSIYLVKVGFYIRCRGHTLSAHICFFVCVWCVCVSQQVVPQRDHRPTGWRYSEKSRQPWQLFGATQQKERRRLLALSQVPAPEQTKPNQTKRSSCFIHSNSLDTVLNTVVNCAVIRSIIEFSDLCSSETHMRT